MGSKGFRTAHGAMICLYIFAGVLEGGEGSYEMSHGRVQYNHFTSNQSSQLYQWKGKHIALLTREGDYQPHEIEPLLHDMDIAYEFFRRVTGKEPQRGESLSGRLAMAVVPDTGPYHRRDGTVIQSAAKGWMGKAGIEYSEGTFDSILEERLKKGRMHGTPLWELGRNFWFGGGYTNYDIGWTEATGGVPEVFAEAMVILTPKATGIVPSEDIRKAEQRNERLLAKYLSDQTLNYHNTLGLGRDSEGAEGGAHRLMAGMIVKLYDNYGEERFLKRFLDEFWSGGGVTRETAVDRFAAAVNAGAGMDLSRMLREEWKLPITSRVPETGSGWAPSLDTASPFLVQGLKALTGGDLSQPLEPDPEELGAVDWGDRHSQPSQTEQFSYEDMGQFSEWDAEAQGDWTVEGVALGGASGLKGGAGVPVMARGVSGPAIASHPMRWWGMMLVWGSTVGFVWRLGKVRLQPQTLRRHEINETLPHD